MDDDVLLRRFVVERSDAAFATLVDRHVNLVYFAALRQTGDAGLAEDVVQMVFTDLARKAGGLLGRPALAGWLYTSTRYAAANVRRTEGRRRAREQEAYVMQELIHGDEAATDWERLRPVIDDALGALPEADREAVLLRFFEGRAFAEIGAALRLTDEAARKRVERALDKMAGALAKRGVTSTSAAVGAAMAAQGAMAAPAGLAATVSGAVTASAAAGAGGWGWFWAAKWNVSLAALAVAGVGVALHQAREANARADEIVRLAEERAGLRARMNALEKKVATTEQWAKAAEADTALLLSAVQSRVASGTGVKASGVRPGGVTADAEAEGPLTPEMVEARYKRGRDLAAAGDAAGALREFLWCFDDGMTRFSAFYGVRGSFLVSAIAKLGERHPAAWEALRERRDAAEADVRRGTANENVAMTYAAINRQFKEDGRTADLIEELTENRVARGVLANTAFDELVKRQKYPDALLGRGPAAMEQLFDHNIARELNRPPPPKGAEAAMERFRAQRRETLVTEMLTNIEVLAGTGKVEEVRKFAGKLLAYDGSEATRRRIAERLQRAGRPGLVSGL